MVTDAGQRDVGDHESAGDHAPTARSPRSTAAGADRFCVWAHYFDVHEHAQLPVDATALARVKTDRRLARDPSRTARCSPASITRSAGCSTGSPRRACDGDTIIVFFSDHGESLGDDPRLPDNHGTVVYQTLTHVPIAIAVPGVHRVAGRGSGRVDRSRADVARAARRGRRDGRARRRGSHADPVRRATGAATAGHPTDGAARVRSVGGDRVAVEAPGPVQGRSGRALRSHAGSGRAGDRAAAEPARVQELRARYAQFPELHLDRTKAGRLWREEQSRPPQVPAPP